ncbi:conserved hypothetical protein [Aurantimonas manganoxydans SI85-9A1]|uniref:site-specific DNA-methyltransferase (adenine-specific) n=1 Tax=Aurantimonas manganoxydans (strain ATCC BAA-1229 / DSM 21871 / SI85-9A1) TaxID=287752 RepID=Q1YJU2_AURMS|nr:BREX-1 system adenine-specific DNA-methyltransferase PglX [Aurantimonas manganoxydans]EAS50781.1 conserved hypothetical protein [Aurantimonas manganoxydans SI85-9A1]
MSVDLSRLKAYAPQARKDFRKAVMERAARIGITAGGIVEAQRQGDVFVVGGTAYDKTFGKQRDALISKVKTEGFDQAIEGIAYTWFNRLVALRFMELHEYLDHGFQIVGPGTAGGTLPEALVNAELLNLPRLPINSVREMKIAGDYEEKLYRAILIAQCNALSETMGFMFEKIGDATELLLPDNLLATDGLIRKLVQNSDTASWQDVEVIGWLYQFYISEKKDDVFDKLKKKNIKITAANIPAATQLFTPHWIVRYLVENSLGRLWLLNNPSSRLAEKMDYYIAPEEPETDFLKIGSPEEIKVCDPACGSGHMLTYAFDLLYMIYEEAGYRARDIPALIIEKNLQGIEIDDRAGALAAFSLTMKARVQDSRFFTRSAEPQICVLEDIVFTETEMRDVSAVVGNNLFTDELGETLGQFEQAKNFGSLIVPKLRDPAETLRVVEAREFGGDLLLKEVQERVVAVLRMAEALSPKYHVVVANPPYMGGKGMNGKLVNWAKEHYPNHYSDLMTCFMDRASILCLENGKWGMINLPSWMFLSSFEDTRRQLINHLTVESLLQLGRGIFGSDFGSVAFVVSKRQHFPGHKGTYRRLFERHVDVRKPETIRDLFLDRDVGYFPLSQEEFRKIPGLIFAYWISEKERDLYSSGELLKDISAPRKGMDTGENEHFLRFWHEVSQDRADLTGGQEQGRRWVPYNKGGEFRRWYGNRDIVLNWEGNGSEVKSRLTWKKKKPTIRNSKHFFEEGFTWTTVSSGGFSARYSPKGAVFDNGGCTLFADSDLWKFGAFLNSTVMSRYLEFLSPTLNFQPGDIGAALFPKAVLPKVAPATALVSYARADWDAYETSWDFTTLPLLSLAHRGETMEDSYATLRDHWQSMTDEMQRLEEENNRIFIDAYGLQDELTAEVPIEEITLTCNPAYRYGVKGTEDERKDLQQRDTIRELISYAVGCMMGRYSVAEPGLVYANAGNVGFDPSRYGGFHADDDGIVPVTDVEWFPDDATTRFIDFLRLTFGEERLGGDLDFVADSLEPKSKTSASETIRKYISRAFFKDHLRTYKNRPIYWLFSSGKERAFECLVYLHRYNESTLGRMRAEYVIPLQTKMQNRIQTIEGEISRGDLSSAQMKARTKELAVLEAKKAELDRFEANLRHVAEERIALDLDDGVKVNYSRFGDLLAATKLVCGTKDEG